MFPFLEVCSILLECGGTHSFNGPPSLLEAFHKVLLCLDLVEDLCRSFNANVTSMCANINANAAAKTIHDHIMNNQQHFPHLSLTPLMEALERLMKETSSNVVILSGFNSLALQQVLLLHQPLPLLH